MQPRRAAEEREVMTTGLQVRCQVSQADSRIANSLENERIVASQRAPDCAAALRGQAPPVMSDQSNGAPHASHSSMTASSVGDTAPAVMKLDIGRPHSPRRWQCIAEAVGVLSAEAT